MFKKFVTVTGAIAASIVLIANPAVAAGSVKKTAKAGSGPPSGAPCSVGRGVTVCFEKYGDIFWVRDEQKDGHHAVGGWGLADGTSDIWDYECHDYKGKSGGWTYCAGWSSKIPEHSKVTFRGLEFNGDRILFNGDGGSELTVATS